MEEWRIVESNNNYQVSSRGRIKNIKTNYISTGTNHDGYRRSTLKSKTLIHVLVAKAFLEVPLTKSHTVDHINRIKDDNRVENLRWSTKSEQVKNRTKGFHNGRPVVQKDLNGNIIRQFKTILEASKELNIGKSCIKEVCKTNYYKSINKIGERLKVQHSAGGFNWEYSDINIIKNEEWKDIIIDNVKLLFSSLGRIKYENGRITYGVSVKGYRIFSINSKHYRMHIYICKLFISERPTENHTVDHINMIKDDNRVTNLRWATKREQNLNRILPEIKIHNSKSVIQYDLENKYLKTFKSILSATKEVNTTKYYIKQVCENNISDAGGFIWKYA